MHVPEPVSAKNSPVRGDERQVESQLSLWFSAAEGSSGDVLQILDGMEFRGRGGCVTEKQRTGKPEQQWSAVSATLKCTKLTGLPVITGEGWKETGVLASVESIQEQARAISRHRNTLTAQPEKWVRRSARTTG